MNITVCPYCNANLDGGSILESFLKQKEEGNKYWSKFSDEEIENKVKEFYSLPYRWGRQILIKNQNNQSDYYMCPDCKEKI